MLIKNILIGTFVDLLGVVDALGLGREKADGGVSEHGIDLIHDTRHLYTRARIDGRKAMSRGIFRWQTKDNICQCEKSRSTLFILLK